MVTVSAKLKEKSTEQSQNFNLKKYIYVYDSDLEFLHTIRTPIITAVYISYVHVKKLNLKKL